jgi:ubiquinone/menaquinone biosynthesis C-methylase UbiE
MVYFGVNNKVTYWVKPEEVSHLNYVSSRSFLSQEISADLEQSIYSNHVYIEKSELIEILNVVKNLDFNPSGIGLELGSGCSAISVELVKQNPSISKIYAVELVPDIIENAAVDLISINNVADKVFPVLGNFDDIKLSDQSVDFVIEWDSLHHSFDLERTIKESSRILKDGGQLFAIDRSHYKISLNRKRELENQKYSKEFLYDKGLDINKVFTRAENGEHEYLLSDYFNAFNKAGFSKVQYFICIDPGFSILKYALISAIPSKMRLNTKFHYIQTWPIRKLILPVLIMNIFKFKRVGRFINLPRKPDSKRFQLKTFILATK